MAASTSKIRKRPGQGRRPEPIRAVRKDPRSRRGTDGSDQWDVLKAADKGKKYVLVNQRDMDAGPEYYLSLGYDAETYRTGGVRFKRGRTAPENEEMVMRGHLLMSIDLEGAEEIEDFGENGVTGQAGADGIENRIIEDGGGKDLMRGLYGQRQVEVRLQARVQPSEYETP